MLNIFRILHDYRQVRKTVRRKDLAVISIQRIFRGVNTRMKFMKEVKRVKEQSATQTALKDRMR